MLEGMGPVSSPEHDPDGRLRHPAQANQLDKVGEKKRVLRVWQTARIGPWSRQIEYMQFGRDGLRPLVFLHSLEYANAPSWGFCVNAAEAGFGTFAIRRPGFGASDMVGNLDAQVKLIGELFEEAGLENIILVAVGSACPVGYRLAATSPRVSYTIYVNCVFNRDIMAEFRPQWLAPIFTQAVQNPAGARLSLEALRQLVRARSAGWLYESILQKSPGDLHFARTFVRDIEASWEIGARMHADTFREEMRYSLNDDDFLTDGVLKRFRGIALSGAETTDTWKAGFEAEARRVGVPFGYLPSGDIFAAYQSAGELLEIVRECG